MRNTAWHTNPVSPRSLVAALLLTLVVLALALSKPPSAEGATFVVATTTDAYDVTPGNGLCQGVLGFPCSLRAAIQEANALPGPDTITLPAGTYPLTREGQGEDAASTGDLDITSDITINGAGWDVTVVDAGDIDRVIEIRQGIVSITGVTLGNGRTSGGGAGGGLGNYSTLTLTGSAVLSSTTISTCGGGIFNEASAVLNIVGGLVQSNGSAAWGGGICNQGALTLTDSLVQDNRAFQECGGGIYNNGDLTVSDSTIAGNRGREGGGLCVENGATADLTGVRLTRNYAADTGGAIYNNGKATLAGSTVHQNSADAVAGKGGGIVNSFGILTVDSSTVSENFAFGDGGGIVNENFGTAQLNQTTVSQNWAGGYGGGVFNDGGSLGPTYVVTTIVSSTFALNRADNNNNFTGDGGGIANAGGTLNLKDTILAGNLVRSTASDCHGPLTSQGYNLVQDLLPNCVIGGDATGNIVDQAALLDELANNGGGTFTHALLQGSPAIDAGSPDCPPPSTDQRGIARPQGNQCDIGSYESLFTAATATASPTAPATPTSTGIITPTSTLAPTVTAAATPAVTATATPLTTPTAVPDGVLHGDVNCDGSIDEADVFVLLRFFAELSNGIQGRPCPSLTAATPEFDWGDINCDGSIDGRDALLVLLFRAGIELPEPTESECASIGDAIALPS
jgi:CSLREA domain-containing protein